MIVYEKPWGQKANLIWKYIPGNKVTYFFTQFFKPNNLAVISLKDIHTFKISWILYKLLINQDKTTGHNEHTVTLLT